MPYQRDLLPSFAGINTFARAPRAGFQDVGPGCVAVLGVPHDGSSTSRQGVRQGPRAIREASADFIYELQASESGALIDVISGRVLHLPQPSSLLDLGDLTLSPLDLPGNLDACRSAFSRIAESGACPVALGGDRFITFPMIEGVKAGSGRSLGLIRISAELSLADPDSQYGPDWSGASVRRILDAGAVEARNTVLVGTQGYIPYREWEYARSQGVTVITADSVKAEGPEATVRRALEIAGQDCDAIYLSLDIGVIDSGYASGTAEVVVGGLTPRNLLAITRELSEFPRIAALDVVEVAPGLDVRGRSERLAAQAVVELIAPPVFGA